MKSKFLEVLIDDNLVGKIALTESGLCAFEYDSNWLQNGFSISPYLLPLENKTFVANRDPFNGNFGVFDDSLPDGWGTLLLDRYLKSKGKDINNLTMLERLSFIGSSGRGALEYRPDATLFQAKQFNDFEEISNQCQKILSEREITPEELENLYKNGGSSGGARPKIFAKINAKEYLIKFNSSIDPKNVGEIEYKYSLLAKEAKINMANTLLIDNKYFAVERFDRVAGKKIHTISASGLTNASFRLHSLDYEDLLLITKSLTKNQSEVLQMFRRMVFNVLIANKDDHSKNFSFQYINNDWKLSPAYDILPSRTFNNMHSTSVNGNGNPSLDDMQKVAERVSISKKQSKQIHDEICDILNNDSEYFSD